MIARGIKVVKIVIAGSRDCPMADGHVEAAVLASPWSGHIHNRIAIILHGGSGCVDHAAARYADRLANNAPPGFYTCANPHTVEYRADWDKHGRAAGPMRNAQMAHDCDAVIAIWDGRSRGTLSMITEAAKLGKPVFVYGVMR